MEEVLLFSIIVTMCPGVPDPWCDSGMKVAYWKLLIPSGMATMEEVKKKKNIVSGK